MNTVYISMPITGFNLQERVETANRYREQILTTYNCSKVITPFDNELGGLVPDKSYGWYMGKDVEYIIDNVDTIFFINGWENSKGACLEEQLGKIYGKTLIYESEEITRDYLLDIGCEYHPLEGSDGWKDFDEYLITIGEYHLTFRHNMSHSPNKEWGLHIDNCCFETVAYVDIQKKSDLNKVLSIFGLEI